ncbi:hypothetical protein J4414_02850 [Candidatus Woesearchaeota archaeon]|nr:hypothetical protein [Candidatus Woesearchaeota archaeon]
MVVRLLGLLDLVAAVSLIFLISGRGEIFALIFALYLLIKSLFFLPDFSSFLDFRLIRLAFCCLAGTKRNFQPIF